MTNEKNLTPWKPGQSGNPAGKPKGTKHLSTLIQEMFNDPQFSYTLSNGKKSNGRVAEAMVRVLIQKALDGDIKAFDILAKYGYGTRLDLTSEYKQLPMPLLGSLSTES